MRLINIDKQSSLPKYKQIVLSIEIAIAEERIKKNQKLPSVNKVSLEFSISRDTVLLAYEALKKRGIIYAILGKGYYVKSVEFSFEQRFFVLFDELNSFKEELYNSFLEQVDNKAQIDIFFHYFNVNMFKKLINESNGNYSKYIIMPSNLAGITDVVNALPKNDVYIIDQTNEHLSSFPSVHQNFVKDIFNALSEGKHRLQLYQKLVLIFPGNKEPIGMVEGFEKFCFENHFDYEVVTSFNENNIKKGSVYITPTDAFLVSIIEQSKHQNLIIGKDIGIISYNDTALKKVVENGITTISTDFKAMGKILAQMVLSNSKSKIENKSQLILRSSI